MNKDKPTNNTPAEATKIDVVITSNI